VLSEKIHNKIYLIGLCLLAASLPVSVVGMSLAQIILFFNYLLEGKFYDKYKYLKNNYEIFFLPLVFLLHVIWLFIIKDQDLNYALNDLRIKLPLFVLPIIIGTSRKIEQKELHYIFFSFITLMFSSGIIIIIRYILKEDLNLGDYRKLSPYISHIRYSILCVIASLISLYFLKNKHLKRYKSIWIFFFLFFLGIIYLLGAKTGLLILLITYTLLIVFYIKRKIIKLIFLFIIFCVFSYSFFIGFKISREFYRGYNLLPNYKAKTLNNREYFFDLKNFSVENGERVWFYICEEELRKEWNKRSRIKYDSLDKKGHLIKYTILRFLTSKNLPKDSFGIAMLSNKEIQAIENSISNQNILYKNKIYNIIYEIIWQIYHYKTTNYADGMSIIQRYLYLKAAIYIIKNNFLFGVGPGNVQKVFDKAYNELNINLSPKYRLRAHNQFITFLITFGIFGFISILYFFFVPFLKNIKLSNWLATLIFFISIISFLNEDTLETQAGITFVLFFYVIFVFGVDKKIYDTKNFKF